MAKKLETGDLPPELRGGPLPQTQKLELPPGVQQPLPPLPNGGAPEPLRRKILKVALGGALFTAGAATEAAIRSPEGIMSPLLQAENAKLKGEIALLKAQAAADKIRHQQEIDNCRAGMGRIVTESGRTIVENLQNKEVYAWDGVYARLLVMKDTFKVLGTPFAGLYDILHAAAQGEEAPGLEALQPGQWGSKVEQASMIAQDLISKIPVYPLEAGIDLQVIRDFQQKDAEVSPSYVVAMAKNPDGIRVGKGGGSAWGNGVEVSVTGNTRLDATTWKHENEHNLHFNLFNPDRPEIREVLHRDPVIHHVETYLDQVYSLLCVWAGMPDEQASVFKHGAPLLLFHTGAVNEYGERMDQIQTAIPEIGTMSIKGNIGAVQRLNAIERQLGLQGVIPAEDVQERLNNIAHKLTRALINSKSLRDKGQPPSEEETSMIGNKDLQSLMRYAQDEVAHYLVGPVQQVGGGLPVDIKHIDNTSPYLTQANGVVQESRFGAFSKIKANDTFSTLHNIYSPEDTSGTPEAPTPAETNSRMVEYGYKKVAESKEEAGTSSLYSVPDAPNALGVRYLYINDEKAHRTLLVAVPKNRYGKVDDRFATQDREDTAGNKVRQYDILASPNDKMTVYSWEDGSVSLEGGEGFTAFQLEPEPVYIQGGDGYIPNINLYKESPIKLHTGLEVRETNAPTFSIPDAGDSQYACVDGYFAYPVSVISAMRLRSKDGSFSLMTLTSSDRAYSFLKSEPR